MPSGDVAVSTYSHAPSPGVGTDWIVAEAPAQRPSKLLDRVRQAIRIRHYSRRTEEAYVGWIRRFILFHGKRHTAQMGEDQVTAFLTSLAVDRRVSASTQNQALSAILFLYEHALGIELEWLDGIVRAKAPLRLPVILTRAEVRAILDRLDGTPKIVGTLLYGAGIRLLECLRLRVKDVDFGRNEIVVRSGKGGRDRRTMLPRSVSGALTQHLQRVRRLHQADLGRGTGWVEMPDALARKYPHAGCDWAWQWVFPATRHYVDAATGQHRRHHLHETVMQRAMRMATLRAGITKPAASQSGTTVAAVSRPAFGKRLRTFAAALTRPSLANFG